MTGYKTITGMSLRQLSEALAAGEVTSRQATQAYLDAIAAADGDVAAYLTVTGPEALAAADASDARRAAGKALARWTACPAALRTTSAPRACALPVPARCWSTGFPLMTPR